MKKLLPLALLIGLVAAAPAAAAPARLAGVVVAKQHGMLLVAGARGAVQAVPGTARVGSRVVVQAGRVRITGRAHRALVRAVVVRRVGSTMFVTAAHRILAIQSGRRLTSATQTTPQPGDVVQAQVAIGAGGTLASQGTQTLGTANDVVVQATISAVGQGTVTLSVNGQSLTITLPAGMTLPATVVGQQVTLRLSFAGGAPQAEPGDDQGDDDQGDEADDDNGTSTTSSGGDHEHGDDGGGDD
jgi:hypothetical protein